MLFGCGNNECLRFRFFFSPLLAAGNTDVEALDEELDEELEDDEREERRLPVADVVEADFFILLATKRVPKDLL